VRGAVDHLAQPDGTAEQEILSIIFRLTSLCTMCHSTRMIPFRLSFQPGISLYEQVVYAAKKAVVSGQMRPGEPFPSVRTLSKELKINPNTAHKVVTHLVNEGLLEVNPGLGTVVAALPPSTAGERSRLLRTELEQLVVEAKRLGVPLNDVEEALAEHWKRLDATGERRKP
jgi:GntR family transcriptional regulator